MFCCTIPILETYHPVIHFLKIHLVFLCYHSYNSSFRNPLVYKLLENIRSHELLGRIRNRTKERRRIGDGWLRVLIDFPLPFHILFQFPIISRNKLKKWQPRAPMKGFWWHLHVGSSLTSYLLNPIPLMMLTPNDWNSNNLHCLIHFLNAVILIQIHYLQIK